VLFGVLILAIGSTIHTGAGEGSQREEAVSHKLKKGWVIGYDPTDTAVILHTRDGGRTWVTLGMMSGPNDLDDMCSPTPETIWAVQNLGGQSGGLIFHVRVEDGHLAVEQFEPEPLYIKEGITCTDDLHAVAVGSKAAQVDPDLPQGIILMTEDGGLTWTSQSVPTNAVSFWKVSFVGARR
jgi:photosystem II stability/assembly factor-like uncharacterized protein